MNHRTSILIRRHTAARHSAVPPIRPPGAPMVLTSPARRAARRARRAWWRVPAPLRGELRRRLIAELRLRLAAELAESVP